MKQRCLHRPHHAVDCQVHPHNVKSQREGINVCFNNPQGFATQKNCLSSLHQIVTQQGNVSRLDGGVASDHPHGNSHISGGQSGSIVDSIPNDRDFILLLQPLHRVYLVFGQLIGGEVIDPGQRGDSSGRAGIIAGEHHYFLHPGLP